MAAALLKAAIQLAVVFVTPFIRKFSEYLANRPYAATATA